MRGSSNGRSPSKRVEIPEVYADVVSSATKAQSLADLVEARRQSAAQCRVEVKHHTAKNWGARHDNEDRVMASSESYGAQALGFHTIGVLDGHDTADASDLVSRELPGVLAKFLKKGMSVVEAYTEAMSELEESLKNTNSTAGTCVLSFTVADRFVWCANLGDCRGCLVHLHVPDADHPAVQIGGAPKVKGLSWMSLDQKASTAEERKRIAEAGGMVIDGRVEGLEPSRTLGDFDVKLNVKKGVISIVPEVRCLELGDGGPAQAVLVCATDGVWDVLSGQDVCQLVTARKEFTRLQASVHSGQQSSHVKCLKDLAEDLVQFSIARGSRDDCTAVVALVSIQPRAEH